MAFQRLAHPEGEAATARAAASLGIPMTVKHLRHQSLEEVRAATDGPLWFQLYVHQDRGINQGDRLRGSRLPGSDALVLTVDVPEIGRRERDERNGFRLSPDPSGREFPGRRERAAPGRWPRVPGSRASSAGCAMPPSNGRTSTG
jgi:4-hydroxymandelate oxidase